MNNIWLQIYNYSQYWRNTFISLFCFYTNDFNTLNKVYRSFLKFTSLYHGRLVEMKQCLHKWTKTFDTREWRFKIPLSTIVIWPTKVSLSFSILWWHRKTRNAPFSNFLYNLYKFIMIYSEWNWNIKMQLTILEKIVNFQNI